MTTRANTPDIAKADTATDIAHQPPADGATGQEQVASTPLLDEQPVDAAALPEPKPYVDPRIEIAKAQREHRDRQTAQIVANVGGPPNPDDLEVRAATPVIPVAGAPDPEPQAATQQQVEDKPQTYKIKVRHNEYDLTRDQLLEAAQMTPEEAKGIPDTSLVVLAQKNRAADSYLQEARQAQKNTPRQADRGDGLTSEPEASAEPEAEKRKPGRLPTKEVLAKAVERIQFGDPEEASDAIAEAVSAVLDQRTRQTRLNEVSQTIDTSVDSFIEANTEFTKPTMTRALFAEATDVITEAVASAIGVDYSKAREVIGTDPQRASQAYQEAIAEGLKLPPPREILEKAATRIRDSIGLPKPPTPTPQPALQPQLTPLQQREAAKSAIPQMPQRSSALADITLQRPASNSTSSALARMRQMYGKGR